MQLWVDHCFDAADAWSKEAKLSKHFWFDEMRFALTSATGFENGMWTTYVGEIAKNTYIEGAKATVKHIVFRICGTPKPHGFDIFGEKDINRSRKCPHFQVHLGKKQF